MIGKILSPLTIIFNDGPHNFQTFRPLAGIFRLQTFHYIHKQFANRINITDLFKQ